MWRKIMKGIAVTALVFCSICPTITGRSFPEDRLPDHIRPLTEIGQRAEWSHDGRTVMFVTKAGGEVQEVDVKTGEISDVSAHLQMPEGWGFYRALYLSNGDYLFTAGPRRREAYLVIASRDLKKHKTFYQIVYEGPAVSRRNLKIAFTPEHETIWIADIEYRDGEPFLVGRKEVVNNRNVVVDGIRYRDILEPQNFRPPEEKELIWAQYGRTEEGVFSAETFGIYLDTGRIVNYSKAPNQYDEPEGIFPDGEYTLTECDRHNPQGTSKIDIYRLRLDGTAGGYVRLTYFSDVPGFRASNPTVSDDGKWIVFQESVSGSAAGSGNGLYLFDLVEAGLAKE
jgi:hypothetical protein